ANLSVGWRGTPRAGTVLIQNEVPEAANLALARALPAEAMLILNAAPARETSAELLARVDVLVVNRVEAEQMGGMDALRRGGAVIETLGGDGCRLGTSDGVTHFPARAVDVVSTHGAGDAFCGALAAALDDGASLTAAIDRAQDHAAAHVAKSQTL
ncbi:MAG: PfkB family carbohydrate kinase, partial [Jannaschia sp.]